MGRWGIYSMDQPGVMKWNFDGGDLKGLTNDKTPDIRARQPVPRTRGVRRYKVPEVVAPVVCGLDSESLNGFWARASLARLSGASG